MNRLITTALGPVTSSGRCTGTMNQQTWFSVLRVTDLKSVPVNQFLCWIYTIARHGWMCRHHTQ